MALNMAEALETVIDNAQETDYSYEPEEDDIDLSLLRLNSFGRSSDRCRANSSPPQFQSYGSFGSSSTAATSPVKRPSPESKEADEPRRKKLFLPRPEEDERMSNLMGYSKVPLPMDCNPTRIRSSPIYKRSLSDTFASPGISTFGSGYTRDGVAQETTPSGNIVPSLPPRPPMFRRSVSDVSPSPYKTLGSSRSTAIPEADFSNPEASEANKMLYVIKDGVRELDQWCNKLIKYGEAVSSVKQDDSPKGEVESQEEEQQKDCKEGVKVDRVGEAFVVEINCPCGRNYRTLFSGRDCYYKLL
ncbi:hypothetical protein EUTSA_v10016999mg [Eutrema salsugineum]|uniref:Uncharacterized protein n=1 Tax=Eutrema salsugineum TaxID=72664 RepID=V4NXZ5_EUTSA|nr:uncharacterized protein LOC18027872 [Eutrema salsugineum]ESQ51806.1 hypothetical protein EUTSA_v10016999mg [Eutrema salsugineum]